MSQFVFTVRGRDGKLVRGDLVADNKQIAVNRLREQGYIVISVKEKPAQLQIFPSRKKVKTKHLALLCRQFAFELGAGMPLVDSLRLAEEESQDVRLKKAFGEIRLDVASGLTLTRSMQKHEFLFPHVFLRLVSAGEASGELPKVFNQLGEYFDKEDELTKSVTQALMYPAVVTIASIAIVLVLIFVVLPMLVKNFATIGVEPPAMTRMILSARSFIVTYWYLVFGLIVAGVISVSAYLRSKGGRYQFDKWILRIPIVGRFLKMVTLARFCRTLSLLLESGLTMVQSLDVTIPIVRNVVISDAFENSRLAMEQGYGLSEPLEQYDFLPKMFVQMVAVGEKSGNLDDTLEQLAEFYEREIYYWVASSAKLIEPVVMLILGIIVLLILLSVYLPMMEMVTQM